MEKYLVGTHCPPESTNGTRQDIVINWKNWSLGIKIIGYPHNNFKMAMLGKEKDLEHSLQCCLQTVWMVSKVPSRIFPEKSSLYQFIFPLMYNAGLSRFISTYDQKLTYNDLHLKTDYFSLPLLCKQLLILQSTFKAWATDSLVRFHFCGFFKHKTVKTNHKTQHFWISHASIIKEKYL